MSSTSRASIAPPSAPSTLDGDRLSSDAGREEKTRAARRGPQGIRWLLADPGRLLVYILLTAAGVLSLFPLYWLFVTSLSSQQFIIKVPPDLIPRDLTVQNYVRLFSTTPVVRWLINTFLIAAAITVFHLLFDSM